MKKLSFILSTMLFTLIVNAQGTQTEDEVYVGRKFGNYREAGTKTPVVVENERSGNGQTIITGVVIRAGLVNVQDSLRDGIGGLYSFDIKKDDGTIIRVGTKDNGFTVPRVIVGKTVTIEGLDLMILPRKRNTLKNDYQKDIQIAATGIIVVN